MNDRHFGNSNNSLMIRFFVVVLILSTFLLQPEAPIAEPLEDFIIRDGDLPGYVIVKKPSWFRPESLWNYINGGALPYLDYGVGDVVTYSGKLVSHEFEIVVDIYDMGNNRSAFGIYSSERFPDYDYITIGVEGYKTENAVCFWKDRYYVKVFSNAPSTPTVEPVERIARAVDTRIPADAGMPAVFDLFPKENMLPKSESFTAKNVLGQDFMTNGFSVSYKRGDEEYQFFILEADDTGSAAEQFSKYREFIGEYGKLEKRKPKIGEEAFSGNEDWYGLMVFARKGRYIAGSVGLADYDAAVTHLKSILDNLD